MAIDSAHYTVIDGWRYYDFEKIGSAQVCESIANRCRNYSLLARVQALACAALSALSLTIPYFLAKNTLYLFGSHQLAILGLVACCPVVALSSLPLMMLSIVTARCWSHYQHLEKQAETATLQRKSLLLRT